MRSSGKSAVVVPSITRIEMEALSHELERSNTMSDQEKGQETSISPQPDAENKKKGTKPAQGELTDQELDKVSGGIIAILIGRGMTVAGSVGASRWWS